MNKLDADVPGAPGLAHHFAPEMGESYSRDPGEVLRVLLVDNDRAFVEATRRELAALGFETDRVTACDDVVGLLDETRGMDAIILDQRQGGADCGADALVRLRRGGVQLPVLIVADRFTPEEEAAALARGAADFVEKARGSAILASRIRLAVEAARRQNVLLDQSDEQSFGPLTLRPWVSRAMWKGQDVGLTVTEYRIVHRLAASAGDHIAYRVIYDTVHGSGFVAGRGENGYKTNVRSLIKRIRAKFMALDESFDAIENFAAFGYRWVCESGDACDGAVGADS